MTEIKPQPITPFQIKRIMKNCAYQVETKNEWVQWVTGDATRTSLKSITHDEAIRIMHAQTGTKPLNEIQKRTFDSSNPQHKYIMSLCHQKQWITHKENYGDVADMDGAFLEWLMSNKSPVQKLLIDMTPRELSKIIVAMGGVVTHNWNK